MAGLNLLPKVEIGGGVPERIKSLARMFSILVLAGYIIILAGVGGWWVWLARQENVVSAEAGKLEEDVKRLAEVEAVLRHEENRARLAEQTLKERSLAGETAGGLSGLAPNVQVATWVWKSKAGQTVGVAASSAAELEVYAKALVPKYGNVKISLMRRTEQGWEANIDVR